jgi:hypothetical protein
VLGKKDSLLRQLVDIGCLEFLLAGDAQITIAQIVGHDVNDVGLSDSFIFIRALLAGAGTH